MKKIERLENKADSGRRTDLYSPSWFNRFIGFIDRLPGPSWLAFLIICFLGFCLTVLLKNFEDPGHAFEFPSIVYLTFIQIAFILSLMDILDRKAEDALENFRPILKAGPEEYKALKNRLTKLPSRPILVLTIIVIIFFSAIRIWMISISPSVTANKEIVSFLTLFTNTPLGNYSFLVFSILWLINFIFIYHTFHQLKTIDFIYTKCSRINLFQKQEIYAFSNVTAATAIGLVLLSPLWLLFERSTITLFINYGFSIIAIFIFVLPLLGVHRLLKEQKNKVLKNISIEKEKVILGILSNLKKNNLDVIKNMEQSLSSIVSTQKEIDKISTWPWESETIRQIFAALLLPVVISIVQFFLKEVFSR